jgi:hypothetical protein
MVSPISALNQNLQRVSLGRFFTFYPLPKLRIPPLRLILAVLDGHVELLQLVADLVWMNHKLPSATEKSRLKTNSPRSSWESLFRMAHLVQISWIQSQHGDK